ncbi:MAG: thioesterase domain-containing protein, partial [Cyanobacteriota bacterium]|nr:thioesterase domain-containing protein [Cyanobacteriota bacterium]
TRLAIGAMSVGGMKRCLQLMHRYATRRSIATGSLIDNPVTLARLSDLTAATTALETLVARISELLDRGCSVPVEAYIACKTSGPEFLWKAVDSLVQLLGGRGYIETNIAPQLLRDARVFRIFEGPTETLNMFLGSRVLHQGAELHQFLCNELGATSVSDRLREAAEQINARWSEPNVAFSDRPSALRWASLLIGEVTTYAILWAALQQVVSRTSSERTHRAIEWVRQQFEQTLKKALTDTPSKSVLLSANEATDLISSYAETIGDLEQTLPGEDNELDEFLRREPTAASPKGNTNSSGTVTSEVKFSTPDSRSSDHSAESIETWLAKWIAKELKIELAAIDTRKSFFNYGLDSVMTVSLAVDIEDWLGRQIPITLAWDYPSIKALAQHLAKEGDVTVSAPRESLVPLQLDGDKPPLFCIYGILLYNDLARNLGKERPVYGVYLQEEVDLLKSGKLDNQQTALTSVAGMAARYLKEIRTLQPVGPYFLAGESFGGLVAFEMAQQLRSQGEKVGLLALLDTEAPGALKELPRTERVSRHLKNFVQKGPSYALEKVAPKIDSSKKQLLSIISKNYGKVDQGSERSLQRYVTEVATNDIRQQIREQAANNYVPHPYPGKVVLFRAMDRSGFEAYSDAQWGWGSLAAGGLEVHHVPGDHIGILKEPHVQVLATNLRACLERTQVDD